MFHAAEQPRDKIRQERKMHVKEIDPNLIPILAAFSQQSGIKNALVAAIEPLQPLEPYPACATCPASFWNWDTELVCFCKVKKEETWGRRAPGVIACAEREMLLAPPEDDRD